MLWWMAPSLQVQVWKDAYQLELERAELLDEQLKVGLDRRG